MPTTSITKIKTNQNNLFLRVARGHFATNSSHSNYYIDVAAQKSRLSEAKAIAHELCKNHKYSNKIVDTILCLDGTEVISTCIADELTKQDYILKQLLKEEVVVHPNSRIQRILSQYLVELTGELKRLQRIEHDNDILENITYLIELIARMGENYQK